MRRRRFLLLIILVWLAQNCASQNISINILSQKSGTARIGDTIYVELTILNTDPTDTLPVYKLRPLISIPASAVELATDGHSLPEGWEFIQRERGAVRLTNGTDRMEPNSGRRIILKLIGRQTGGPHKIAANLMFSNGATPGSSPGTSTKGDNPADNSSITTCQIL